MEDQANSSEEEPIKIQTRTEEEQEIIDKSSDEQSMKKEIHDMAEPIIIGTKET